MTIAQIKKRISHCFSKAAKPYEQHAVIQQEIGKNLLNKVIPQIATITTLLELGCGTGHDLAKLCHALPQARAFGLDLAANMVVQAKQQYSQNNYIQADFDHIPFTDKYFDLLYSNLALQWSVNIDLTLAEWYRVLKHGGILAFSTLLPNTLVELQQTFEYLALPAPVNTFIPKESLRSMLDNSFELLVFESKEHTLYFDDLFSVMRHLKNTGANCVLKGNTQGLMGKYLWQQLEQHYPKSQPEQKFGVTYQALYVIARG